MRYQEHAVRGKLRRLAKREVPAEVDLWPIIYRRAMARHGAVGVSGSSSRQVGAVLWVGGPFLAMIVLLLAFGIAATVLFSGAQSGHSPVVTRPTVAAIPMGAPASGDLPSAPPPSCPVTRPPQSPFIPPTPYPSMVPPLYGDQFWYGTPALWTWLPADGTWHTLRDKSFWWRQGFDGSVEQQPALTLAGRRLDGQAPPFVAPAPATNGFRTDLGAFMLTMVDLPTPGCWEITGRYPGAELRFVVWVAP